MLIFVSPFLIVVKSLTEGKVCAPRDKNLSCASLYPWVGMAVVTTTCFVSIFHKFAFKNLL